jgi:hypothetical protein
MWASLHPVLEENATKSTTFRHHGFLSFHTNAGYGVPLCISKGRVNCTVKRVQFLHHQNTLVGSMHGKT